MTGPVLETQDRRRGICRDGSAAIRQEQSPSTREPPRVMTSIEMLSFHRSSLHQTYISDVLLAEVQRLPRDRSRLRQLENDVVRMNATKRVSCFRSSLHRPNNGASQMAEVVRQPCNRTITRRGKRGMVIMSAMKWLHASG